MSDVPPPINAEPIDDTSSPKKKRGVLGLDTLINMVADESSDAGNLFIAIGTGLNKLKELKRKSKVVQEIDDDEEE